MFVDFASGLNPPINASVNIPVWFELHHVTPTARYTPTPSQTLPTQAPPPRFKPHMKHILPGVDLSDYVLQTSGKYLS